MGCGMPHKDNTPQDVTTMKSANDSQVWLTFYDHHAEEEAEIEAAQSDGKLCGKKAQVAH